MKIPHELHLPRCRMTEDYFEMLYRAFASRVNAQFDLLYTSELRKLFNNLLDKTKEFDWFLEQYCPDKRLDRYDRSIFTTRRLLLIFFLRYWNSGVGEETVRKLTRNYKQKEEVPSLFYEEHRKKEAKARRAFRPKLSDIFLN